MIPLRRLRYCMFTVLYVRFDSILLSYENKKKIVIVIDMLHSALSPSLPSAFDTQNLFSSPLPSVASKQFVTSTACVRIKEITLALK